MTQEALREQIKEELKGYVNARRECRQIEGQIEQIRSVMESPRIVELDGMPHGSGGGSDPLAGLVEELIQLEEKYKDKLHRLHAEMAKVEDMIDGLDSVERQVLRCRYIDGLIWEEVCVKLNYSWAQTHRIHGGALDKLVEIEMGVREPEQLPEWIEDGVPYWNGDTEYIQPVKCSKCGEVQEYEFAFCPSCGAEMKIREVIT